MGVGGGTRNVQRAPIYTHMCFDMLVSHCHGFFPSLSLSHHSWSPAKPMTCIFILVLLPLSCFFWGGYIYIYRYSSQTKIETKWKEAIHTLLPGFESIAVGFFWPKIAIGDLLDSIRHVFSLFLFPSPVYVRHRHTPYILRAYVHTYFEYRRFETFVKSCAYVVAACVLCALCMFDTWPSILLYSKFSESVYSCNR